MPDPSLSQRRPNAAYFGRNGFTETTESQPEGEHPLLAAEKHRLALYILTQKGRPIPSLQQMRAELDKPDDIPNLRERIKELQTQHTNDLERLYDTHAHDYHDEALDRYLAKDDLQYLVQGENNPVAIASYEKLESLYQESRKAHDLVTKWDNDLDHLRYSYLRQILPLYEQLEKLESQDTDSRRRRDAQFPASINEYRAARSKDIQIRIARFLTSDTQKQESIMSEFGWAWRQIQPLKEEFEKNAEFKAEILEKVREIEARDPRRKRS